VTAFRASEVGGGGEGDSRGQDRGTTTGARRSPLRVEAANDFAAAQGRVPPARQPYDRPSRPGAGCGLSHPRRRVRMRRGRGGGIAALFFPGKVHGKFGPMPPPPPPPRPQRRSPRRSSGGGRPHFSECRWGERAGPAGETPPRDLPEIPNPHPTTRDRPRTDAGVSGIRPKSVVQKQMRLFRAGNAKLGDVHIPPRAFPIFRVVRRTLHPANATRGHVMPAFKDMVRVFARQQARFHIAPSVEYWHICRC
jgi:hypothetical protein